MSYPSSGITPFGFAVTNGHMIVTNAGGGAVNQSSVTSYNTNGSFNIADGPVPNNQTAACWIALGSYDYYGYVTNIGSNTISTYSIGSDGGLDVLHAVAATTGVAPIDIVVSGNENFVYNVNAGSHTIGIYKRLPNGKLLNKGNVSGLTEYVAGLTAY